MARFLHPLSKKRTLLFLTSAYLLHSPLFSAEQNKQESVNTDRFTLRHIESKGIGYNQGYTTLEAFFLPLEPLRGRWVPFLDGRAHIFNNARPAANIGVGARYLNSRIWGANLYYDFRQTSKLNYSQISCGLETIGEKIDARINGYFPVGKHTKIYGRTTFDHFQGNYMYLSQKEQFALQGVNAELGVHLGRSKKIAFYTAFGPYYFCNNSKQAIGGSARISMDIQDAFKLEVNTSYDTLFGWIGQGQISLSYAFQPRRFDRLRGQKKPSSPSFDIRTRLLQKVDKFEIIVVDTKKHKTKAINPTTGQPYFFLFLDPNNAENGVGTFESPINSLENIENFVPLHHEPIETLPLSLPAELAPENRMTLHSVEEIPSKTPEEPLIHRLEVIASPPPLTTPSEKSMQLIAEVPNISPQKPALNEIFLVPDKGQELQTTLGTVMVPASQKGHPKITHVKDIEYQGKKTHVFVITMEEDDVDSQ
ncbi:MAG: inverse autotransporter beta domain-containing protein [Rhabdochlamydiaceae bacterium]|jgi:hypothetical protein